MPSYFARRDHAGNFDEMILFWSMKFWFCHFEFSELSIQYKISLEHYQSSICHLKRLIRITDKYDSYCMRER